MDVHPEACSGSAVAAHPIPALISGRLGSRPAPHGRNRRRRLSMCYRGPQPLRCEPLCCQWRCCQRCHHGGGRQRPGPRCRPPGPHHRPSRGGTEKQRRPAPWRTPPTVGCGRSTRCRTSMPPAAASLRPLQACTSRRSGMALLCNYRNGRNCSVECSTVYRIVVILFGPTVKNVLITSIILRNFVMFLLCCCLSL